MREDFAKLLVERERLGGGTKFGHLRQNKKFNIGDDEGTFGGKEGMKTRYKISGDYKSFNENLNPLKGYLHSRVGKQWDKTYSEIRSNFDTRKTINNHIMDHLFQYVEIHTKVIDGKVVAMSQYNSKGYVPIKDCYSEYYVHPKTGVLCKTNRIPYKAQIRKSKAEKAREEAKTFRVLADGSQLRKVDDVWYHFTLEKLPEAVIEFVQPTGPDTATYGYPPKLWSKLNPQERQRYGLQRVISGAVYDVLLEQQTWKGKDHRWYRYSGNRDLKTTPLKDHYFATKKTASHKLLKEHGLAV